MPEVSTRVYKFALEAFKNRLEALLDDPFGFDPDDIKGTIAEYRGLAADLGLDFDAVCRDVGSNYELARLRKIEEEAH